MSGEDRRRAFELVPSLAYYKDELAIFERLLVKWQSKLNLVGPSTVENMWVRHFADSAQLIDAVPKGKRWADLGSGAGFPGMVVSFSMKDHRAGEMHLIESDKRKAAFLREVSRETGSPAIVHNARCEDVLTDIAPNIVASRAMADLNTLIGYAKPFVEKGGIGLFMKGRDIASELTKTSIPSNFTLSITQSRIDPESSVVRVESI